MISVARMNVEVGRALARRAAKLERRSARIVVLEARVRKHAARIAVLNQRLGAARLEERARKAELRELRKAQLRLPL